MDNKSNGSEAPLEKPDAEGPSPNAEAAKYRTERNVALRRMAALDAVVSAHNIDISAITPEAVRGLEISDGKVVEAFSYEAPKIRAPKGSSKTGKPASTQSAGLTREKLRTMTPEAISRLPWKEVTAALRA